MQIERLDPRTWSLRGSKIPQSSSGILSRLGIQLEREYQREVRELKLLLDRPGELEGAQRVLTHVARARAAVVETSSASRDVEATTELVDTLMSETIALLTDLSTDHLEARQGLCRILSRLLTAHSHFPKVSQVQQEVIETETTVVVPSDLLWTAHRQLFPAERMMVVAGRREGPRIQLSSIVDVTGQANSGHVRAEPGKLAETLITMDQTGSYLAGWFHSHPGSGVHGTHPSSTDIRQHQSWIRDYSENLLSAIFVQDGFVRFWGTAIETEAIQIEILGEGTRMEETHVYRLQAS